MISLYLPLGISQLENKNHKYIEHEKQHKKKALCVHIVA